MNILVLHGPNLNLLGERPGDERGGTLGQLNAEIERKAAALGVSVRILQSNHEGALIDALHQARAWADAVVINPGALAHTSYVLREAIAAVGHPTLEVHLNDLRRREAWRRKSVIKDVCEAQIQGKGFDSYLLALEQLARGKEKAKGPAKKRKTPAAKPVKAPSRKTLGRRVQQVAEQAPKLPASDFLTRALVRQKIADRLSGKLTPAGLSTWARAKWMDVQRGAPAESGQRELLEDSLQQLVLSAMPASRLSDEQLIELMAQLNG